MNNFLLFFLLLIFEIKCVEIGYISYSGGNIGDDIQSIAAKRFLPSSSIPIDREKLGEFEHESIVHTLVSGWYLHTENFPIPLDKRWPPSPSINPFFISFHLTPACLDLVLTKETIDYLVKNGPIGARDTYTQNELQKRDIPSYFSGCLTLTLENNFHQEREEVMYAVDLSEDEFHHLEKLVKIKLIKLTHSIDDTIFENNTELRHLYAENILNKYRKAKCVVTSRLHAALPCLAFGTPVLLVRDLDARFDGLSSLIRNCSPNDFLSNNFDFDFDNPPQNLNEYLIIRENLIKRMNDWVKSLK